MEHGIRFTAHLLNPDPPLAATRRRFGASLRKPALSTVEVGRLHAIPQARLPGTARKRWANRLIFSAYQPQLSPILLANRSCYHGVLLMEMQCLNLHFLTAHDLSVLLASTRKLRAHCALRTIPSLTRSEQNRWLRGRRTAPYVVTLRHPVRHHE